MNTHLHPTPVRPATRSLLAGLTGSSAGGALLALGGALGPSPWLLLAVPVALFALAALMLSPAAAFLLTALVVPVERLGRLTDDDAMLTISLMRIVGSLTLLSFLLNAVLRRQRILFGSAFWLYALYLGIALTGIFHSTHLLGTVRHCGAIVGNLLFLFIVVNLGRSSRLARQAVAVWLLSTVAAGLYTIIAWHIGPGVPDAELSATDARFSTVMSDASEWEALDSVARATGPTSHSAVYGMNLMLSLPLFLYFRKHMAGHFGRGLILLAVGITLYNVLLTNTRAVIIVTALTLLLCAVRGLLRITAGGVVALLIAGAAMLPLVPEAVWTRVLDSSNYSQQKSATLQARLAYWSAGLETIGEHWLSGIGVGNQLEVPKRIKVAGVEQTTAHNEYIYTAMEVGVFGWLVFFGFVALMYVAARRAQQLAARAGTGGELHADFFVAIQVAMLATLVFAVQVDVFHFPLKGWWLLAGLGFAQYRAMVDGAAAPPPRPAQPPRGGSPDRPPPQPQQGQPPAPAPAGRDAVDITVVLVGLNACRYIVDCIASLRAARWGGCSYEVIYVDNGSRDDSVAQVRSLYPEVPVIANPDNRGYCPAANQGARLARGRYLFFLNDDTIVLDDAVARALRTLQSRPGCGVVGSRLLNLDRTDQWSGRRFPTLWQAVLGRRAWLARWLPNAAPLSDYLCKAEVARGEPFEVDWVSAAALLVSASDFWAVGGFAQDYYYWHEAVFCDRMRAQGRSVVLDPLSQIVHYEGKGSGKRSYAVLRWHILDFHRGALRCYCEHYGLSRRHPLRWLVGAGLMARAACLLAGNWLFAPRR